MFKHSITLFALSTFLLWGCIKTTSSPEPLSSPAPANSQLPRLVSDAEGHLLLSWVEGDSTDQNTHVLKFSSLEGNEWSAPLPVVGGDDWFVNWADFPSVIMAAGRPTAAHWLQKVPGNTYSYHVRVSVFREDENWSAPLTPHFDSTATEHGFVSMVPWNDKSTLAIWLDGRRTANRQEGEYFDMSKAMTLRSAIISDGGMVSAGNLIDDIVCDCCQTALVKTPYGALAAYRNRTEGEIRDVYVSRYTDGNWSDPESVYNDEWKIGACPVNGPALAISDSVAVIAWYTGAENHRRVKVAISTDAGYTFSDPVTIDNGNPIGRVDAAVSSEGKVFVSWMEQADHEEIAELRVRAISSDSQPGASKVVAAMNSSRKSGFPQMEMRGKRLIFAWTEIGDLPRVKVRSLSSTFRN